MMENLDVNVTSGEISDPSAICPVCRGSTFIGQTIACEICELWYHFQCVGVKQTDDVVTKEDIPFYCPICRIPKPSPPKKPKKKRKKSETKATTVPTTSVNPGIKLKIKTFGGSKGSPTLAVTSTSIEPKIAPPTSTASTTIQESKKGIKRRRKSEDEEEKWLNAVESGDVSNIVEPELRSIKDPKLMTARQRAMVDKASMDIDDSSVDSGHMALDYGYKKKTPDSSEETLKAKALKSQKRKEVELERREQDKKKTMDRLLKKKEKSAKPVKAVKEKKEFPQITYLLTLNGASISLPENSEFPFDSKPAKPSPPVVKCAVSGCENDKNYNCSRTGIPLCSLACYKQNLLQLSAK